MPGMMPPMMPGMMMPPRMPAAAVQPTGPVTLLTTFSVLCFAHKYCVICKMLNDEFAQSSNTSITIIYKDVIIKK